MLVVTRLRAQTPDDAGHEAAGEELRSGLLHALGILAAKPGYVGGEVGRNVDDPTLWVLTTRWENVGSYRRALGSYEGKMHIQPLMVHALDEPSAYELVEEGTDLNEAKSRDAVLGRATEEPVTKGR
jgi:Antibiotic biosynthesis monooxygenase